MRTFVFSTAFMAIIACLLWASAFAGIKIGLPYTTPLQFAGIRFFIAGLLILPFTGAGRNYFRFVRENIRLILFVGIMNNFLQYSFFYLGLNLVPAALAAIIIGASPLFVAMTAHFFMPGDKMSWQKFLIFLIGISGIVLVSFGRNDFSTIEEVSWLGIFLLLMVNFVSGIGNVVVARDNTNFPPLVLSSAAMMIGGASLFILSVFVEGFEFDIKPFEYYASLAWLSFLSAAAVSIWFVLLKRKGVKVSDLNFWKFLIPVAGAILAWIILPDEFPSLVAIAGMLIIASSLVLLNIYKRHHSKKNMFQIKS